MDRLTPESEERPLSDIEPFLRLRVAATGGDRLEVLCSDVTALLDELTRLRAGVTGLNAAVIDMRSLSVSRAALLDTQCDENERLRASLAEAEQDRTRLDIIAVRFSERDMGLDAAEILGLPLSYRGDAVTPAALREAIDRAALSTAEDAPT